MAHTWPSETQAAYKVGHDERCSICGVPRHPHGDDEQRARVEGECPGPGANGVAWRERSRTEPVEARVGEVERTQE